MSRLRVKDLVKDFGGVRAVDRVSFAVEPGERFAIIGPNGAGKSTLFNLIAGNLPVTSGEIWLDERNITRLSLEVCANLGIGRTFQRNNLFLGMRVIDNVRLAVQHQMGVAAHWFRPLQRYDGVNERAQALLARVGLAGEAERLVSELAYGQQRALEIALALATEPRVLLLDEPTAGMSPAETSEMVALLQGLPDALTLLIVEHDMDVIFSLADRVLVLHYGQVLALGTPDEVRGNPRVQEIYLGT